MKNTTLYYTDVNTIETVIICLKMIKYIDQPHINKGVISGKEMVGVIRSLHLVCLTHSCKIQAT